MEEHDIIITGDDLAGLAATVAARDYGIESILILEHDRELEGILDQCIHNGLDLHTFKEGLTGPGYATRYEEQVFDRGIEYKLNTVVMDINRGKVVTAMNREEGLFEIRAKAAILTVRYREYSRGTLDIPGHRPAGVSSAGTAQRLVNMEGFMPGREVMILGSGGTGLIMAGHMNLEGVKVKVMTGLTLHSDDLKRSIARCLNDHDTPLELNYTVIDIRGKKRPTGIALTTVDEKGKSVPETKEGYDCGTLPLSVEPIPENEPSGSMRVEVNRIAPGPIVNKNLETSVEDISACDNMFHIHDLMDFMLERAAAAGKNTARYVMEGEVDRQGHEVNLRVVDGVRYTVPCTMNPQRMKNIQVVRSRVGDVYKNCYIGVYFDDEQVIHKKCLVMAPGEMEEIKLEKEELLLHLEPKTTTIKVEEA